tara:strand:+ start:417 stop:533 length:117 start_codon:yes stop_codon:yes gene_type:complete
MNNKYDFIIIGVSAAGMMSVIEAVKRGLVFGFIAGQYA